MDARPLPDLDAADRPLQALGAGLRLRLTALREDQGEFIAAQAGEEVAGTDQLGQLIGNPPEHDIADLVATQVIDVLELVQIQKQDGALVTVTLGLIEDALEVLVETPPVVQSGQRVMIGEPDQARLGLLAVVLELLHAIGEGLGGLTELVEFVAGREPATDLGQDLPQFRIATLRQQGQGGGDAA
jgi:hypothetical protein